ncbi:aminoacyl-tRNA hydrolase [Candidatus Saccharibacteria bacterium]|nr:aminoacyl-tRNA hydrolase [Candidatus Saccharibacteria bacterium]
MKLVVGLGNPEAKHNFTRHNFGFLALDFYLKRSGGSWNEKPRFSAIFAEIEQVLADGAREKVIFIKPQDYYNLSGQAVATYVRYYKIALSDILVICDNFDLEFGKIRYRLSGSAGGNNGLKSVDKELGTSDYPRLRLGTENTELKNKIGAVDFVLSKFTPDEKAKLPEILSEVCEKIDEFIKE